MGLYFGGVIGFALTTLPGMIRRRNFGGRGEWITALVLMILNTSASLFFFFRGLDLLAKSGCGGLGYPIAIGVCVVGFSLYSLLILREKFARLSLAGLIADDFHQARIRPGVNNNQHYLNRHRMGNQQ